MDRRALTSAAILSVALAGAPRAEEVERFDFEPTAVIGVAPLPGLEQPLERVPSNVQVLDAPALDPLGGANLTDALGGRAGGVHLGQTQNNPWQPDVVYRGFTSSFLLGAPQGLSVFQDGVRLNDFLGDAMNWDLVPEGALSSLVVVPGADPVYGRNTLGGAIALGTKSGRTHPGTMIEASYGSFDRASVSASQGSVLGDDGAFDAFLHGDSTREDGFRDFSRSRVARLFARGGWQGGETEAWITFNLARNDLRGNGFAPESLLAEDRSAVYTHPDRFEPALEFVTAHVSRTFGPSFRVDASAHGRWLSIDQRNADADDDAEETEALAGVINEAAIEQRRFGGTLQAVHRGEGGFGENVLAFGLDAEAGRADVALTEQQGVLEPSRTVTATGDVELATDVETDGTALGVYATDTFTPFPWLGLTASVRFDRTTIEIENLLDPAAGGSHRFSRPSPAIGATLRPSEALDLYARYGESFRAPSAIELSCANEDDPCPLPIAFADDPPLDEVKARTVEIGARARHGRALRASLALFRTELDDDVLFVASSRSEGFFRNVDETRRQGVELGLVGTLGPIDGFAQYSWTRATFESRAAFPSALGENVARPGDRIPGIPDHLLKAGFEASLPWSLRFGLDLRTVGRVRLRGDEANERRPLPAYAIVSAHLAHTWRAVTLFARAENLFDAETESFGTFGENVLEDERVERFFAPVAPLGGWFGVRIVL